MAPGKKGKSKANNKRVQTLHNFFTSPGAGPSKKSNVPKTSSTAAKASSSSSNKRKSLPDPKEIIVIDSDSDSDDEVKVVSTAQKKRKRRESSSDVELVLDQPIKRVNAVVSAPPALSFGQPSALLTVSSSPIRAVESEPSVPPETGTDASSLSFGAPSVLLRGQIPDSPAVGTSLFGNPSSLLVQSVDDGASPVTELETDLGGEDEWGMGDDELAVEPDEDDEDTAQIDEPDAPAEDHSCPLCHKVLDKLSETEREAHVNACLDAASGSPKAGSSNSHLKRLSTLSVPSALAHQPPNAHRSNAFKVLMTSRSEMAIWNEATTAEASRATKKNRRKAPFYKVMQGMPIAVDAFRYGCIPGVTAYFLTHAHSDHYTNLSSSWKHGPIYCSEGTANLIIHILSVDKKWVHPLPMDVSTVIPNTGGVHVTLIEANHCPGSSLFLFEGPQTVDAGDSTFKSPFVGSSKTFRYLHCGDFRASPQHTSHPAVQGKHIDHVYLDTTYLDPKYTFPPQPLVISACAEFAKRIASGKTHDPAAHKMDSWLTSVACDPKGKQKAQPERILMVVGTYSVGKERIVKAVAQAVNSKIYCDSRKAAILRCQPDPELHALLTSDPLGADVHILPLGMISPEKLQHYLQRFKGIFTKVVGFRPTGWTFRPPSGAAQLPTIASVISLTQQKTFTYANLRPAHGTSAALQLIPVPYSEHSSFFELTCFALSIQYGRMIATVNVGSERSRTKMAGWMQKWEAEKKKRKKGEVVPHRRFDYW